jgi:hypothetical protein
VTRFSLKHLCSLSREYDLFAPDARDWRDLTEGEFHPPLPVAGQALVWGFAVLRSAERAGKTDLPCREVSERDPADLLALALRLENRTGQYSWAEQARMGNFIRRFVAPEAIAALTTLITPEQSVRWLSRVDAYTECPAVLQRLVDENLLDIKTAARTRDLPAGFFEALAAQPARFSFSQRRFLALSLREVVRRDRLDAAGTETLWRDLLAKDDPMAALRAWRFPELTALLERFAEQTAPLARRGVTVIPPEGFEGDAFTFSFTAASPAVFAKKAAALKEFEDAVDRLFDLL